MKKYSEILKECPLFDGIEEQELLRMLDCLGAKVEHFDKKYTIMSEGTPANWIGIMLSGSAQVLQIDYYGNRSILSDLQPAEMFAEAFACAGVQTVPVAVVANEPCEVMLINSDRVLHPCANHCGFHHRLIFNLMRNLASKTLIFHQKLEILAKRTTRDKLMTYLLLCAKKAGKSKFSIPFDRQELADYLEVDRSGLSAEISKLRNEGALKSNKKQFELL